MSKEKTYKNLNNNDENSIKEFNLITRIKALQINTTERISEIKELKQSLLEDFNIKSTLNIEKNNKQVIKQKDLIISAFKKEIEDLNNIIANLSLNEKMKESKITEQAVTIENSNKNLSKLSSNYSILEEKLIEENNQRKQMNEYNNFLSETIDYINYLYN